MGQVVHSASANSPSRKPIKQSGFRKRETTNPSALVRKSAGANGLSFAEFSSSKLAQITESQATNVSAKKQKRDSHIPAAMCSLALPCGGLLKSGVPIGGCLLEDKRVRWKHNYQSAHCRFENMA